MKSLFYDVLLPTWCYNAVKFIVFSDQSALVQNY